MPLAEARHSRGKSHAMWWHGWIKQRKNLCPFPHDRPSNNHCMMRRAASAIVPLIAPIADSMPVLIIHHPFFKPDRSRNHSSENQTRCLPAPASNLSTVLLVFFFERPALNFSPTCTACTKPQPFLIRKKLPHPGIKNQKVLAAYQLRCEKRKLAANNAFAQCAEGTLRNAACRPQECLLRQLSRQQVTGTSHERGPKSIHTSSCHRGTL